MASNKLSLHVRYDDSFTASNFWDALIAQPKGAAKRSTATLFIVLSIIKNEDFVRRMILIICSGMLSKDSSVHQIFFYWVQKTKV